MTNTLTYANIGFMNTRYAYDFTDVTELRALKNYIIVKDMNFEFRTTLSGLILPSDDKKSSGIRPRWAEVINVGPDNTDVKVGQYILVEHGRWTRGARIRLNGEEMVVRKVDPNAIIFISDEPMTDESMSDKVLA